MTVQQELNKLEVDSKNVIKAFTILETFKVKTTGDDVQQRWRVYAGPKNVQEQQEKAEAESRGAAAG